MLDRANCPYGRASRGAAYTLLAKLYLNAEVYINTPVSYTHLLQQKKFTVAEVMYMVGFSNHSYFSKCFQAEFGKTPKQYMQPAVDEENHNK